MPTSTIVRTSENTDRNPPRSSVKCRSQTISKPIAANPDSARARLVQTRVSVLASRTSCPPLGGPDFAPPGGPDFPPLGGPDFAPPGAMALVRLKADTTYDRDSTIAPTPETTFNATATNCV